MAHLLRFECSWTTPDRTRTCDLRFRKPMLYPAELRAHRGKKHLCRKLAIIYSQDFDIARKSDLSYTTILEKQGVIVKKKENFTEQNPDFAHPVDREQDRKDDLDEHLRQTQDESRDSLVFRLKQGNRAAATELVDVYYEQIYLFMRRIGHSHQISEDLAQECFLQAWQHIGQLRSPTVLNSWLYRIAANISNLYWRRGKGRERAGIEGMEVPDSKGAEYEEIEHLEEVKLLKKAVAHLSMKLRQAIVLHYMQHLTIAEAAEAAGVSKGTFKSRLSRALKALRKQFTSTK